MIGRRWQAGNPDRLGLLGVLTIFNFRDESFKLIFNQDKSNLSCQLSKTTPFKVLYTSTFVFCLRAVKTDFCTGSLDLFA